MCCKHSNIELLRFFVFDRLGHDRKGQDSTGYGYDKSSEIEIIDAQMGERGHLMYPLERLQKFGREMQ